MSREQQVRDAIERFIASVRQDTDKHLEALASELLQVIRGDMRTSRADVDRAAVEVARALAKGGSQARHDLIASVVNAIRRLDEATTLRGILDALAEGAAAEASRVAVLLVEERTLRSYSHHGFAPGQGPVDLTLDGAPLLATAVDLRQLTSVPPAGDPPDPRVPVFMRVPQGQVGLAIPLVVAREVVAIVYVDGADRQPDQPGAPVWTEQVEVLVRHASARLETVTSQRTVEVLTGP